jgi:hypothetical protein
MYETDGAICGDKVRARGYCSRHYKVMLRANAFEPTRPISGNPETVARNVGHLDRARLLLQAHTEELVSILLEAARKAAKRGDSKPAEWALLHSRTLEPVLTGGAAARPNGKDTDTGVKVIIGVQLSTQVPSTSTQVLAVQTTDQQTQVPAVSSGQNAGALDRPGTNPPNSPVDAVLVE